MKRIQDEIETLKLPQVIFIFLLVGLTIYWNSVMHPFVHDDVVFIQKNPQIGDLRNSVSAFFQTSFSSNATSIINVYYRPLLETIYRLEFRIFHFNSYWYHLVNVLIHTINSILVYIFLRLLINHKSIAFVIGFLFLIHPVQSEAVACISGISNLLFAWTCLLSFIFYLLSGRDKKLHQKVLCYILSLAFFSMGLFVKEQTVVFPLIILVYEICFYNPAKGSRGIKSLHLLGFVVISLGYLSFRKLILGMTVAPLFTYPQELWLRLCAIPKTIFIYLTLLIFPHNLHYYRSLDILKPYVGSFILLIGLCGMIIKLIRLIPAAQRRLFYFGLGWFVISLLPTLNILPLIIEYSYIFIAEHFLYFPMIGFFLSLVVGCAYCIKNVSEKDKNNFAFVFSAIILIFVVMTIKQNIYWRGEIPLFKRTLKFEPQLGRVHILLAKAYYSDRQIDKAMEEYKRALEIMTGYVQKAQGTQAENFYLGFIKGIHFDLGHCYAVLGDLFNSVRQYQEALRIDPRDEVIHNNLGSVYLGLNNIDLAMKHFQQALKLNPLNLMAKNNLAICYIQKENTQEAERLLREILKTDQYFSAAQQNLEQLLMKKTP